MWRSRTIIILILGAGAIIIWRFFNIQIQQGADLRRIFLAEVSGVNGRSFARGSVFMTDKFHKRVPLALNKDRYEIYAVPKEIKNPASVASYITDLLDISQSENEILTARLSRKTNFYEHITYVDTKQEQDKFLKSGFQGIYSRKVISRYYPQQNLASQVIGFFGEDKNGWRGLYGIEEFYDKELARGADLDLTLDFNLQKYVENDLKDLISEREAVSASALVLDAKTGAVKAMASAPNFNPNQYSKVKNLNLFMNPLVENQYEFGSVIKPLVYAAGLEEKVITPDTTYYDAGVIKVDDFTIANFDKKAHGTVSLRQALNFSYNTGAIFVGSRLGLDKLEEYFRKFGLGFLTGIDLPNEMAGDLSQLDKPYARQAHLYTASFGQGISVTAFQLAYAYMALANQGVVLQPFIVKNSISGGDDNDVGMFRDKVISKESAAQIIDMMEGVANVGYGRNAKIPGYSLAVKTGTAQIPVNGKYTDDTIQSIGGFFPASDPRFVVFVMLEKPAVGLSASATVTHSMKNILQFLANYYEISPDEK